MPLPQKKFFQIPGAQVYLVGGAVRDALLGIASKDCDWLVVGSQPQDLLDLNFKQVGKEFPVFLHPQTQEEYALARTERKAGHGYQGFEFDFASTTTLEQDLIRRDLTINAIAQDEHGELHDPYNGQQDLNNRILRHVSPAFTEDPLRVLRVARFAAQLGEYEFSLAPETLELMQTISNSGELEFLQAERIWQETARALQTQHPHIYIKTLRDCGALKIIFPELDALFGVPQTEKYHPEIDSGIHTLMVMEQSAKLSEALPVRFAAMTHDFGKGTTPKEILPRHIGHEQRSFNMLKKFYKRFPIPKECQEVANKVAKLHLYPHKAFELRAATILKLFKQLDAYRKPQHFEYYLLACLADSKGRTGFENNHFPEIDYFRECYVNAKQVSAKSVLDKYPANEKPSGKVLGDAIDEERITAIQKVKDIWSNKAP